MRQLPVASPRSCSARDCGRPVTARGMCRRHYLQAWRAGTLDASALRDRHVEVCPPEHPHDLETCWLEHSCRCMQCRHARKMERQRRRNRLLAYDQAVTQPRVPAHKVRRHVLALRDQGLGLDRIADAAGVSRSVVADVVYGPRGAEKAGNPARFIKYRTVRVDHANKLLAVTTNQVDAAYISPVGTQRRLQALVAIGYTQTHLAEQLEMRVGNLSKIILGHRPRLRVETHQAVYQVFTRLWSTPQHGKRADASRRLAARRGWLGPLHWDDIDHDPAPATVDLLEEFVIDEAAVTLACSGEQVKLRPQERREGIRRLHAAKLTDGQIATRLHMAPETVQRIRKQLQLPAVAGADRQLIA